MVERVHIVREVVVLPEVGHAVVVEVVAKGQIGRLHVVLQERQVRARGRKIENAVAVEIQARKDAVAHALGIEVRIKGIVVLQLVGPIVEIVVVCD